MRRFWWLVLAWLAALAGPARAQQFRVVLLGTGTPRPMLERFGPSILVQAGKENLLFDAGRGCTIRLWQLGIGHIDKVFLTHLHSDHTVGIPDVWLTGWIFGRSAPLEVWGPQGTAAMMAGLEQAYAYDVHVRRDVDEKLPAAGAEVQPHEIDEGLVYDKDGIRITAFLVDHGPVKPAFGYRIDYGGHSVVLSGDTRPSENLVKHAQGADVLIHEVYAVTPEELAKNPHERQILKHHSSPEEAGEIFARVKPKLGVYSHIGRGSVAAGELVRRTRTTYQGPLEVGEDLMAIDIGPEIKVERQAQNKR